MMVGMSVKIGRVTYVPAIHSTATDHTSPAIMPASINGRLVMAPVAPKAQSDCLRGR